MALSHPGGAEELKQGCCRCRCFVPAVCAGYPCPHSEGRGESRFCPILSHLVTKLGKPLTSVIYLCFVKGLLCPEMLSGIRIRGAGTKFLPPVLGCCDWNTLHGQGDRADGCLQAVMVSESHRPLARWHFVPRYCCDVCSNKNTWEGVREGMGSWKWPYPQSSQIGMVAIKTKDSKGKKN